MAFITQRKRIGVPVSVCVFMCACVRISQTRQHLTRLKLHAVPPPGSFMGVSARLSAGLRGKGGGGGPEDRQTREAMGSVCAAPGQQQRHPWPHLGILGPAQSQRAFIRPPSTGLSGRYLHRSGWRSLDTNVVLGENSQGFRRGLREDGYTQYGLGSSLEP